MDHNHNINGRIALTMGAGSVAVGLISASTPMGPHEVKLRQRLRELRTAGKLSYLKVQWLPSAAPLSREDRAKLIIDILDGPIDPAGIEMADRTMNPADALAPAA